MFPTLSLPLFFSIFLSKQLTASITVGNEDGNSFVKRKSLQKSDKVFKQSFENQN
jgi:hypothetical protein